MSSPSRVDRLVIVLGGEQNLPPKLPPPVIITSPQPKQDITPIEEALSEPSPGNDWWNAAPKVSIPAPPPPQTSKPSTGTFTASFGQPAPLGLNFCPLLAVSKFPYKFVHKQYMQEVASAFFDEAKFWNRDWEVYYIWSTVFETSKPTTFVPEYQVLEFIDEINTHIPKAGVRITDSNREEGLVLNFDDVNHESFRPKFLACTTSRDQLENAMANVPVPASPKSPVSGRTLEAFKAKMQLAADISKNKSKAAKTKRQAENVVKRQDMVRMMTRGQRYLGLTGTENDSLLQDISALSVQPIDVDKAAPHPFSNDVIFVAVDVEAYEDPPHPITEVGIATLDTRDLVSKPPGTNGENWQSCIRARHFIIDEHKRKVNRKYVDGCPDKFEFNDHQSTIVPDAQISRTVSQCFNPPYSNAYPSINDAKEKRNVVLVGHDIVADINYLRRIGISLANFSCIIDTVDTVALFRAFTKDPSARSLGHILNEFDLMGWHLHNAGNDAVYTLWAMLAICVKNAADQGSQEVAEAHQQKLQERMEVAVEQAKERVKDESEGWESTGDDGGVPVPPKENQVEPKKAKGVLYTVGGKVLDV